MASILGDHGRSFNFHPERLAEYRKRFTAQKLTFANMEDPTLEGPLDLSAPENQDLVLTVNVSGVDFTILKMNLKRLPDSRLSKLATKTVINGHLYFPRNAEIFRGIVDLYNTGELHLNERWCGAAVKNELLYWGIDVELASPCCSHILTDYKDEFTHMERLQHVFESGAWDSTEKASTWSNARRWIWEFFDLPSTKLGKFGRYCRIVIVLISVGIMTLRTTTLARQFQPGYNETSLLDIPEGKGQKEWMYEITDQWVWVYWVDYSCTFYFTIEYIIRFIVSPTKMGFMRSVLNFCDLICNLSDWYVILNRFSGKSFLFNPDLYAWCHTLKVFRVMRLMKFSSKYGGLRVLLLAMKSSMREMMLMAMIISLGMITFAGLIYNAEFKMDDQFMNIPHSCWYAVITMTTVGYGDQYPRTAVGKVIGSFCALSGIVIISMLIPIIAKNFSEYYRYAADCQAQEEAANEARACFKSGYELCCDNGDVILERRRRKGDSRNSMLLGRMRRETMTPPVVL